MDKSEDADETEEGRARRRRRYRLTVVTAVLVVLLLGAGLLIVRPWSSDSAATAKSVATPTPATSAGDTEPTLSNRLVVGDVGETLTVQWANDGNANIGQMGQSTGMRSLSVLAAPGADSDGPWLSVSVDLLDRFDRKSFDASNYIGDPGGRGVTIGDINGYYVESGWTGSHMMVFGPVNDGFAVSFNAAGITQAQMVSIAEEMTLKEDGDRALAAPVFGQRAAELGLVPVTSFTQESWGFGGGAMISVTGGLTPFGTSMSYVTDKGHTITVTNEAVPEGMDLLAVARVMLKDVEEVKVHGLPALKGSDQFSGDVVLWVEGGRSVSVMGDMGDMLAVAESVAVADESAWNDLIAASQANMGNVGTMISESWLIGAGDLEDSTTWVVEGGLDDDGLLVLCVAGFSNDGGSMQGCSGVTHDVTAPALLMTDQLSVNGGPGVGLVATAPNEFAGAILRFTDEDGKVTEAPLKVIRDDWTFIAAAIGVATKGSAVLVAADGTELAHLEITDDNLVGGGVGAGGRVVTTSATVAQATVVQGTVVQGSAPADTNPPTTDSVAG